MWVLPSLTSSTSSVLHGSSLHAYIYTTNPNSFSPIAHFMQSPSLHAYIADQRHRDADRHRYTHRRMKRWMAAAVTWHCIHANRALDDEHRQSVVIRRAHAQRHVVGAVFALLAIDCRGCCQGRQSWGVGGRNPHILGRGSWGVACGRVVKYYTISYHVQKLC